MCEKTLGYIEKEVNIKEVIEKQEQRIELLKFWQGNDNILEDDIRIEENKLKNYLSCSTDIQ